MEDRAKNTSIITLVVNSVFGDRLMQPFNFPLVFRKNKTRQ